MARQKGIIHITGTIGDVNYYISRGKALARTAGGGFNGEAIKNKDSMVRVRENASEFGHCSQVKKAFRMTLVSFLPKITGRSFHSRMMQLFLGIKAMDAVSERGKRRVVHGLQTAKGKRMLKQFELTPKHLLLQILLDKSSIDWANQTLSVQNFNPDDFKSPKAATHIGVTLGVLDFDFETLDSSLGNSATHLIELGTGTHSFELVPTVVAPLLSTGIVVLGLRFYELIDAEAYELEVKVGAGILDVKIV